jgi:hypothetical protein
MMAGLWRGKYFLLGLVSLALGVCLSLGISVIAVLSFILNERVSGLWSLLPLLLAVGGPVLFWAVLPVTGRARRNRRKMWQAGRST